MCLCGGSVLSPGSKRLDVQLGNGSTGVCLCGGSVLSPGSKRLDVQLGNESTGVCVWWVCSVPR